MLLTAIVLSATAAFTCQDAQSTPPAQRLGTELAAYATDLELSFAELHDLLVWRHALAQDGRAALRQLLEVKLLGQLAAEHGIEITTQMFAKRWDEYDREVRAATGDSLDAYLVSEGVDRDTFRDYLRLSMVQEILSRRDLKIPDGEEISAEQQSDWIESVITSRGYEEEPHPWSGGVVARCGDLTIGRDEYVVQLRDSISREIMFEDCYELLLEKSIRARLPDLSEEALERAVAAEIDRRSQEIEENPKFKGVPYEDLLRAQGLSLEALRRDPAIRVSALAHMWTERRYGDEDLRGFYEEERELYDGLYGEGVEVSALVLRAARFKNELNPRTFEDAEGELNELKGRVHSAEDFARLCRVHSEDQSTGEEGGKLGIVTRGSLAVQAPLREAVFEILDQRPGNVAGTLIGPTRIQGGVVLAYLGNRRPAPTWETMVQFVQMELRRRWISNALPKDSVVIWLDAE